MAQAQAGDPVSSNAAAGRRKTKHEKALAELAFSNRKASETGSDTSHSETGSDTSHEDLPPPPTRKSLWAVCQGRLGLQEERDLQRATEASRRDATSAAWSAAPRGGAGGASGGRSERDNYQGDVSPFCGLPNLGNTCFVSAVMQLLFPVYCPSAAAAEAVGSGGGSKVSDTFSQLMAAMLPGNAAGKLSSMVAKFIDALFSDSEVGSWSKFGLQDGDGETRQRGQQQSADEFLQFMVEKVQWLHARFAYTEKGQAASILYVGLAPMADVELSTLIHAQYAGGVLPLSGFQDHLAVVIKRWRKKGLQVVKDPQIISKWETLVIYNQNGNVDAQFELSGFIQHKGHALDQGHYICCSKRMHADRTEWLTFDDKHVSPREEAPRAREEASRNCFILHYVRTGDGSGAPAISAEFQTQVEKVKIAIQQQAEGDEWEQAPMDLITETQKEWAARFKHVKALLPASFWTNTLNDWVRALSGTHKCSEDIAAKAIELAMSAKEAVDSHHGTGHLVGTSPPLSTEPDLAMWNERGTWNINPHIHDRALVYGLVDRLILQHRIYRDLLRVPMNDSERTIFIQRPEQSGKTFTCILSAWLCNLCYGMAAYVLLRAGSGAKEDYGKFGGDVHKLNRMIWEVMLGWTFEGSGRGRRYKKLPESKFQLRLFQRDSELTDDTLREAFMQKFELNAFNLHDDRKLDSVKADCVMKNRYPIMYSRLTTASNVERARRLEMDTLIREYGVDEDGFANVALIIDEYQMGLKVGTRVQEELHQPFNKDSDMFKVLASAIEAQHRTGHLDEQIDGCAELRKRIKLWQNKGGDRDSRLECSSFSAALRGQQRISATQVSGMTCSEEWDWRIASIIELAVDEEYYGHETSKGIDPNKELRVEWRGSSDLEPLESHPWTDILEKLGMLDVPELQKFVLDEVFVELQRDGYAHILLQALVSNNAKIFDVARFLIGYADDKFPEKPTIAVTAYMYTTAGSFPGGPWLIFSDAALPLMQQIREVAQDMFINFDSKRRTPVPDNQIVLQTGSQIAEKIKSHAQIPNALQIPKGVHLKWILALVDRAVEKLEYAKRNIKVISVGANMFKVGMTCKSFEHRMSVTAGVISVTERKEKNLTMEDIAQGMAGRVSGPRGGDPYFQERGHDGPPRVVGSGDWRDKYIAYKKMLAFTMQSARDRVRRGGGRDQPLLKAMYDLDYEGFSDLPDEHNIYGSQTAREKKRAGGVDTWNDNIKRSVKQGKTSGVGAATPSRNAGFYGTTERADLRRRALDIAENYPHLFKTTEGSRMPTFEDKVWKKWRPGSSAYYKGEIIEVNVDISQTGLLYKVRFDPDEDHPDGYVEEYQLDPDMYEWSWENPDGCE